jgi:hypothetical protein
VGKIFLPDVLAQKAEIQPFTWRVFLWDLGSDGERGAERNSHKHTYKIAHESFKYDPKMNEIGDSDQGGGS